MTFKPLSNLAKIERAAAPAFKAAAPETLLWAQEKAFFEIALRDAQGKPHGPQSTPAPVIWEAIEQGVETTIESAKQAIRVVAAMGLSMNPLAAHVYFVPRRARRKRDAEKWSDFDANVPWVIHPWPSYRGLAFIATNYCSALDFGAEVVFQADRFEYLGPFALPVHAATRIKNERLHDKAEGVYAGARLLAQGQVIERAEFIDAATIAKIRALSEMPNSLMWHPDKLWTEGWRKAAVRRLAKLTMNAAPRMLAAESSLQRVERYTFDGDGQVVAVDGFPRETSETQQEASGATQPQKRRGASALRKALSSAQERAAEAQSDEESTNEADEATIYPIPNPAPSEHPPGSVEWWIDQIQATETLEQLDTLMAAMLERRLDEGDDAPAYRAALKKQRESLKHAAREAS